MLLHALGRLDTTPPSTKPLAPIPCYRGVSLDFQFTGDFCAFGHFCSTTTSEAMAKNFLFGRGTLFEFEAVPRNALGIKEYSKFGMEDEVLVGPWSTFKVKKTTKDGNITRVTLTPSAGNGSSWCYFL